MSRVYFHSPSGDAELYGSERAYAGIRTGDMAFSFLGLNHFSTKARETYLPLLPGSYLHTVKPERFLESFRVWWGGSLTDEKFRVGDVTIDPWNLTLNTAIVAGSCAIELLARIHASCEIHGYVEGPHREWLADIISAGRMDKVLRANQGWEDVETLLRARDDEPVVMSYSVCDSFPDAWKVMGWGSEEDYEQEENRYNKWEALGSEGQWDLGMKWLRKTGEGSVDLHPDMWGLRGFGDPAWSVFDLLEAINES